MKMSRKFWWIKMIVYILKAVVLVKNHISERDHKNSNVLVKNQIICFSAIIIILKDYI